MRMALETDVFRERQRINIRGTIMITKYRFGAPVRTDATVTELPLSSNVPAWLRCREENGKYAFGYALSQQDCVYGLGEQVRGINKRGWIYNSWNYDDPRITEGRTQLYASHNFIVVSGARTFGAFFDCAGRVTFDIGYTDKDALTVTSCDVDLYVIEGESILDIVHQFRLLIGTSYIPPKWAFGYGQSRWGYKNEADIRKIAEEYERHQMPLDMIYLDIDYMDCYKDFTVNKRAFPNLSALSAELKEKGIRLVPIIDAAVKAEKGYSVYDEGVERGYFCADVQGEPYVVGVWPGDSVLPDVLNRDARHWFGSQYRALLDCGIEGFWNDMNEPGIFYSRGSLDRALQVAADARGKNLVLEDFDRVSGAFGTLANNENDYRSFYHKTEAGLVCHYDAHNLYGYHMTRAASEYFGEYCPDRRYLLFSRSSYIGMHRYGGVWTGDNCSWWSHLLLNLKMMPSLDMCGFLFAGADLGGHGDNTTEDLLLRWLAFGIFTPLMRNHYTRTAREQECYQFGDKAAFRNILGMRYSLLPYLYSEYVKCALRAEMMFKPLAFVYTQDERAKNTEDQILVGESLMIAPVYEQNAKGRYVYLPERMKMIRMRAGDDFIEEIYEKGDYYIEVPIDEVVFFLREGKVLPLAKPALNVASLDEEHLNWVKFIREDTVYELCKDDGFTLSGAKAGICSVTVKA